MTGATGLVGGAVLSRLASSNQAPTYCLVRPQRGRTLHQRLIERLGRLGPDARIDERIIPISGDVRYPALALDDETVGLLRSDVETIVHCAANTSFLASADSWSTNTEGTRNLLRLASQMPKLRQFVFIGSAASSISCADVEIDEEAPTSEPTHFVEYTRTKQAAEDALLSQPSSYQKVIIRPSYVIPDELLTSATIRQAIWPLSIMARCGLLPIAPQARLDVIPLSVVADYIARVVLTSPKRPLYYLSGGVGHSPMWRDVIGVVSRAIGRPSEVELIKPEDWPRRQLEVTPKL
ncbi:MAG: SDR family oxidoreductase, partial [Devosia sp.]